eukprot:CAMPEP_0202940966 /NCGR_PEP_ID=MMETSP1395-20130829/1091_1 /ASSEMBLY_ACC=CAM_ASM_000871 /TAXON_ID=5961 /ORGANISM="Blepharisma japonicum, Strain Stock R1072" /LENGTH=284 /DNA_ID=CAMNT_0049635785 /DNA_START=74 /DNA_END=925 /DNA_ORIENTATION=-
MSRTLRTIARIINPPELPEGDGARVRRVVGTNQLKNLDPFLMMDHFFVSKPAGFPDHPHRGFETVTYMITGSCKHEDFKGYAGEIGPGAVQWMTAGKGIMHAEMPGTDSMEGLQLWVNLSREYKMCEPNYQDAGDSEILKAEGDGVRATIIAGTCLGQTARTVTRTPTYYFVIELGRGKTLNQEIPDGWNGYIYVLNGTVSIGNSNLSRFQAGILTQNGELRIESSEGAKFALLAGRPIGEPVVQYGPFVMNTREEIEETFNDFRNYRNGFEAGRGWVSKIRDG